MFWYRFRFFKSDRAAANRLNSSPASIASYSAPNAKSSSCCISSIACAKSTKAISRQTTAPRSGRGGMTNPTSAPTNPIKEVSKISKSSSKSSDGGDASVVGGAPAGGGGIDILVLIRMLFAFDSSAVMPCEENPPLCIGWDVFRRHTVTPSANKIRIIITAAAVPPPLDFPHLSGSFSFGPRSEHIEENDAAASMLAASIVDRL